jgi:hypothetical protein
MSSNKPTHEAYVVTGEGEKARWTKIGVGFFKNEGMTLLLDAMPLTPRMVIRPTKPATDAKGGPK